MKKKVFIVSRNQTVLSDVIGEGLSRLGYEIVVTGNAQKTLQNYPKKFPISVFIDLDSFPGNEGMKLAEEIRSDFAPTFITVITGFQKIKDVIQEVRKWDFDYLIKPFHFEQVVALMERSEKMRRIQEEYAELREQVRKLEKENYELRQQFRQLLPDEKVFHPKSVDRPKSIIDDKKAALSYARQKKIPLNPKG